MDYIKIFVKLIVKSGQKARVHLDESGNIKRFIFRCDCFDLVEFLKGRQSQDIGHDEVLCWFSDNFYFLDFLVNLGFDDEVLLSAVYFDVDGCEYDYSFFSESVCDIYWIESPKQKLAEDFAREESYGYQYDEYIKRFGWDNSNYFFY